MVFLALIWGLVISMRDTPLRTDWLKLKGLEAMKLRCQIVMDSFGGLVLAMCRYQQEFTNKKRI